MTRIKRTYKFQCVMLNLAIYFIYRDHAHPVDFTNEDFFIFYFWLFKKIK